MKLQQSESSLFMTISAAEIEQHRLKRYEERVCFCFMVTEVFLRRNREEVKQLDSSSVRLSSAC